jgi:hypothetical protein
MRLADVWASEQQSDDRIALIPNQLLKTMISPALSQLPESHYQTLRRLSEYLCDWINQSKCASRSKMIEFWIPILFGAIEDHYDIRRFFIDICVMRHDAVFKAEAPPLQPLLSPLPVSNFSQADQFPINVFIDDASSEECKVFSQRIPTSSTVGDLCRLIASDARYAKDSDRLSGGTFHLAAALH